MMPYLDVIYRPNSRNLTPCKDGCMCDDCQDAIDTRIDAARTPDPYDFDGYLFDTPRPRLVA